MKLQKRNGKYITSTKLFSIDVLGENIYIDRAWDTLEDAFNFIRLMA